ncbi:MAG: bifunctional phosphopantothenoylcysteine decarboxylase/phosphopantothenate--cysteine ligase CoaBC [Ignavibacteriaceae bacterium]|nr:MAG: flavoprotein [Chlorobi bacterium OLB4]MBV6399636.1 Coenzyme A biosynthesis bifunctional protein CoaBC [Ignavibacteria bacterium]MCC6885628.1 bifunctional phosphopantothenoylcysteine decarboxylase/phosphopantothenate--cysteine ligase CoaBC [Ignavibacteriales bacterium]MEB2330349.1 bifunctional phosphopantothenoylcysteine decarboxylase/phosphopantothenate--cysteine ligase CoaBC [Ignavibacteriaceae bacterium]
MLKGKKILVGVSGGIAAYKICTLIRLLKKADADVRVLMTPSAVNFISPLTLSVLSGNDVHINFFSDVSETNTVINAETSHVYLALWADLFVIAPATLNTISKAVNGITDNLLLATLFSSRSPVIFVPAMDHDMLVHPVTQKNFESLLSLGYDLIQPEEGELASGLTGYGRMAEPDTIFNRILSKFETQTDLAGKKIIVTAGPTHEYIDRVRYISNPSSGKMGFELARAASVRGANVVLISGPVGLPDIQDVKRINVVSADEMLSKIQENLIGTDVVIMSAAVEDLKPVSPVKEKIKKDKLNDRFSIDFEKTVDILHYLGKHKEGFKLIGFAVETENTVDNARRKLETKNLDMIVLNNPNEKGAGFRTDTNIVTLITSSEELKLQIMSKYQVANAILDKLLLMR